MTAIDVLFDPLTNDLPGQCYVSSGPAVTRQRIEIRLNTLLGDWFLDDTAGIDWQGWLSTKPFQPAVVSARVRQEIQETPGVQSVTSWAYDLDRSTGTLTMEGEIAIDGADQAQPISVAASPPSVGNAIPWVVWMRRLSVYRP